MAHRTSTSDSPRWRPLALAGAIALTAIFGLASPGEADMELVEPEVPVFKVEIGESPVRGPAFAKVTIIEFADFEDPYSARVSVTLDRLREEFPDDVRLVWKNNPLSFHKNARAAALASEVVRRHGDFWRFWSLLYTDGTVRRPLDTKIIRKLALKSGVRPAAYDRTIDDPAVAAAVDADIALAKKLGLTGTPSFLVNGVKLVGARPYDSFAAEVRHGIARADALLKSGVSRRKLYATLVAEGMTAAPPKPARATIAPRPTPAMPWEPGAEVHTIPIGGSPVGGPRTAPVTLVEFVGFQCPFCKRLQETLIEIHAKYRGQVRFVFKHFPLDFHTDGRLAAEASLAAHAQGKFWLYHDMLFANSRALKRPDLERYAEELGLDMKKFRRALDRHTYLPAVEKDIALGKRIGVTGTPAVFINGKKLSGARPFADFARAIDHELGRR